MAFSDNIAATKPYIFGGIIGIIAFAILAFSLDWVVTTGAKNEAVKQARVETAATLCEERGLTHWQEQGKKVAALDGWDNQEREDLAKQFTPDLAALAEISDEITDRCDELLEDNS